MDRARSGRRPTYGGGEGGRSLRHLEVWCEALLKEERCEGQTAWCYCIEGARGNGAVTRPLQRVRAKYEHYREMIGLFEAMLLRIYWKRGREQGVFKASRQVAH